MAKPIETLSPTDEAIFRTATLKSLQGAAEDPNRIGAEYMPEIIEASLIQLTDTGSATLPAGSLGLNSNGEVVIHNNESNGDDLPNLINSKNYQEVLAIIGMSDLRNTSYIKTLASIKLPSQVAVNGKIIVISGEIVVDNLLATAPDQFVYFGIRNASSSKTGNGIIDGDWTLMDFPAAGNHKIRFSFFMGVQTGDNLLELRANRCNAEKLTLPNTPGAISTHESIWLQDTDYWPISTGLVTIGQPIDIELILASYDTSGSVNGSIYIEGHVSVKHT
jgi:hypothetical protein